MAERNFKEGIDAGIIGTSEGIKFEYEVERNPNVITGDSKFLYYQLKECMARAEQINIIVSFLMESGVRLLLKDLKAALDRGVKIRILTGNYLGITQPSALYLLKTDLGDRIELHFYANLKKSFHPKSYIFHYTNSAEIFVGSSNISYSALTSAIEWNYRFSSATNPRDFDDFYATYEDLFAKHSYAITEEVLADYSAHWKRPNVQKDLDSYDDTAEKKVISIIQPRGAQIEALYALQKSREEGYDKGITVVPTGVGKTFLAAFDSKEYKRILFVAHREEILKQASISFLQIDGEKKQGFFYSTIKEKDADIIFALVQTLGKEEYLSEQYFPRDYFDYIIIDEFHHAAANNYKRIIEYFTPQFLLGLTATPERRDNKNVYELCDYNVVYDVRLKEAINKGWLVPFRYYGIYDNSVDYGKIKYLYGKYDEKELEKQLMIHQRADLILKNYLKYGSKRALGFCSSRFHAEYMAEYFSKNGVSSVAVHSGESGEYTEERGTAIEGLKDGVLKVIFSVDIFNEGLDIKAIDMVMLLRPTESQTVFLQQLGRGLRKDKGKQYVNVLDFIGNYKKANLIPFFLSGSKYSASDGKKNSLQEYGFPDDCVVDFDFELIDLFKKQAEQELTIKEKIYEQFSTVMDEVGSVPTRVELFTLMDTEVYDNLEGKMQLNPFKSYLEYLENLSLLTEEEQKVYQGFGREFINMIETTSMSKSYKMPLLLAFYNAGHIKMKITSDDVYQSFKKYYSKASNKVDMLKDKSTADVDKWEEKEFVKLAVNNPIKFMKKTHADCFKEVEGYVLALTDGMQAFIENPAFVKHMKDAIDFKSIEYYRKRYEGKSTPCLPH